jgi:LPXTG-motif cell wall-anchored protein
MHLKLKATIAIALASITALTFPAAAQASSLGLPSGESIYAINYSGTGSLVNIATSGTETTVFAGNLTDKYPGRTAFNPTDQSAYWLVSGFPTKLYKTDVTTGNSTLVGTVTLDSASPFVETIAIDKTGHGYVIGDDSGSAKLYSLDLTSGALALINTVDTLINSSTHNFSVRSIAYNPVDNLIYAVNDESGEMQLSTVNLTGTTVTDLGVKSGNNGDDPGQWYSLAFDSAGTMWSTAPSRGLWQATPATWSTTGSTLVSTQDLAELSQGTYIFVAYIVPAANNGGGTLANTGTSNGKLLTTGALALMALLAGAGLMTLKRRNN